MLGSIVPVGRAVGTSEKRRWWAQSGGNRTRSDTNLAWSDYNKRADQFLALCLHKLENGLCQGGTGVARIANEDDTG